MAKSFLCRLAQTTRAGSPKQDTQVGKRHGAIHLKLLVTGATGFIGRTLTAALSERHEIVASLRTPANSVYCSPALHAVQVGELGPSTEWGSHLNGVEVVVHLAGRAHVLNEDAGFDAAASFHRVNVLGTERLAREASKRGVRRFVFISSVGVHGRDSCGEPFHESLPAAPTDPYAVSKWRAEQVLHRIALETGMEMVIIRPPLVYGPNVPGNFRSILSLIRSGIPLPLSHARALRSLVGVGNLASFLRLCIESAAAAGETFLVSDGEDICVADLCRRLAAAMNLPIRLFPVPNAALWIAARLTRRTKTFNQLFRPLTVDASKARNLLNWSPPFLLADGIRATAQWFNSHNK
jgi:nucleoside-diphosphate-sugar epimerase